MIELLNSENISVVLILFLLKLLLVSKWCAKYENACLRRLLAESITLNGLCKLGLSRLVNNVQDGRWVEFLGSNSTIFRHRYENLKNKREAIASLLLLLGFGLIKCHVIAR
jgi:archaellum biogenesis protein FlaJ (TadC family)